MRWILKILRRMFVRRKYVIVTWYGGIKFYYKGSNSLWTRDIQGAKIYNTSPEFEWIGFWHKIEEL